MKLQVVKDHTNIQYLNVDEVVIDATKSHLQCLGPLTEWVCALKYLVPSWQGPCTHKVQSWSHHLVEDVEDPVDGAKDPKDDVEAFADDG